MSDEEGDHWDDSIEDWREAQQSMASFRPIQTGDVIEGQYSGKEDPAKIEIGTIIHFPDGTFGRALGKVDASGNIKVLVASTWKGDQVGMTAEMWAHIKELHRVGKLIGNFNDVMVAEIDRLRVENAAGESSLKRWKALHDAKAAELKRVLDAIENHRSLITKVGYSHVSNESQALWDKTIPKRTIEELEAESARLRKEIEKLAGVKR